MGNNFFVRLADKYPFISWCVYADVEYVGIIQNRDDSVTTIYDYAALVEQQDKLDFLELGSVWWWESNRSVPINIFLRNDWDRFRFTLRTFNNKDLAVVHGPICSLSDLARRKTKRRSITLVRRMK